MTGSTQSALPGITKLPKGSRRYLFWAAAGFGACVFESYLLVAWVASGDAKPTPVGASPMPDWMPTATATWEALTTGALIATLYWFVFRPWRATRRLSPDGLLCLAFFTVVWQDTLLNYTAPFFTWNSGFLNFGGWNNHIPGWSGDQGNLFATPLWLIGFYAWGFFVSAVIGGHVLTGARSRWPSLGRLPLIGICFAALATVVLCFELPLMRLGFWSMPGAIRAVSLFPGRYYQFPLIEPILLGGTLTLWACLRHFRTVAGLTSAELGLEAREPGRATTSLRFLALAGAANAIFLLAYNVPAALINPHGDEWPPDVVSRSYLTDQQCAGKTTIVCGASR